MSESGKSRPAGVFATHQKPADLRGQKPPGFREFTPRAVICGLVVAAIMGASYPYVVLKPGFGPNVSVVSALFGYLALGIVFKNYNRWENNIVQTAGTAAAQTASLREKRSSFWTRRGSRRSGRRTCLRPVP